MRDFTDLPNDLPRPPLGPVQKPTEPPSPPPPPRHIAQGVWQDPVTKRMWTTLAPPACSEHANREMILRDRWGAAAVENMLDGEARAAEDVAIAKLEFEKLEFETRRAEAAAMIVGCDFASDRDHTAVVAVDYRGVAPGNHRVIDQYWDSPFGAFATRNDPAAASLVQCQRMLDHFQREMVSAMCLTPGVLGIAETYDDEGLTGPPIRTYCTAALSAHHRRIYKPLK